MVGVVTTPVSPQGWDEFPGPRHEDEVMASHEGAPSVAVQAATHGAPYIPGGVPALDKGPRPGEVMGAAGSVTGNINSGAGVY
jgi:hypothetical protein